MSASRADVLRAVRGLDAPERDVLRARFGLDREIPRSLTAIGEDLGVTRDHVRQIEFRALRRLAGSLERQGLLSAQLPPVPAARDALWSVTLAAPVRSSPREPRPPAGRRTVGAYQRVRTRWLRDEDRHAFTAYQSGIPVERIAASLGRSVLAVVRRLVRLGVITEGERERYRNRPPRVRNPRRG